MVRYKTCTEPMRSLEAAVVPEFALLTRDCMCRSAFKTYVKKIVNRRNSITGVLYRDDPTIMAWDLANEPYVLGDASGDVLKVCCAAGLQCYTRRCSARTEGSALSHGDACLQSAAIRWQASRADEIIM